MLSQVEFYPYLLRSKCAEFFLNLRYFYRKSLIDCDTFLNFIATAICKLLVFFQNLRYSYYRKACLARFPKRNKHGEQFL